MSTDEQTDARRPLVALSVGPGIRSGVQPARAWAQPRPALRRTRVPRRTLSSQRRLRLLRGLVVRSQRVLAYRQAPGHLRPAEVVSEYGADERGAGIGCVGRSARRSAQRSGVLVHRWGVKERVATGADEADEADGDAGEAQRAAAGSRLVELYERELVPMTRLAFLLTGSIEVAQDLVHDSFLKVEARLDGVASPGGYLRTTVVNECRMWLRRQRLDRARHRQVVDEVVAPAEVQDLWWVLQDLPHRQRVAVILRYYLDLPSDEIAQILGCRPSTARSLVHRGLETLRGALDDQQ